MNRSYVQPKKRKLTRCASSPIVINHKRKSTAYVRIVPKVENNLIKALLAPARGCSANRKPRWPARSLAPIHDLRSSSISFGRNFLKTPFTLSHTRFTPPFTPLHSCVLSSFIAKSWLRLMLSPFHRWPTPRVSANPTTREPGVCGGANPVGLEVNCLVTAMFQLLRHPLAHLLRHRLTHLYASRTIPFSLATLR